jgi:hypothetical protein
MRPPGECIAVSLVSRGVSLGLHDDFPGHIRMHPAIERILSRLREAALELIIGVECCRFELVLGAVNGVGYVVVVSPANLRTCFQRNQARVVNAKLSILPSLISATGENDDLYGAYVDLGIKRCEPAVHRVAVALTASARTEFSKPAYIRWQHRWQDLRLSLQLCD